MNGNTPSDHFDCLIIGGGPDGLTAALTLARQRHTAAVFDSGEYHNAGTPYVHTVPTWDHRPPAEFRAAARANTLANYQTVTYIDVPVTTVHNHTGEADVSTRGQNCFSLTTGDGRTFHGAKLILASGVEDIYPAIAGFAEAWPTGIFHCLFCHGYEERDAASCGLLAVGPMVGTAAGALHFARNALQLARRAVIYTHGDPEVAREAEARFGRAADRLSVDARKIARIDKVDDGSAAVVVHFEDGSEVRQAFLAHMPGSVPRGNFIEQLGLEVAMGNVATRGMFHETSVRGVFAAGDLITHQKIFNIAVSSGCSAGAGVAVQLQADNWGHEPLGAH